MFLHIYYRNVLNQRLERFLRQTGFYSVQHWAVNKPYLIMYIYVTYWNNDEGKDIFEARLFLFINVILFERFA